MLADQNSKPNWAGLHGIKSADFVRLELGRQSKRSIAKADQC